MDRRTHCQRHSGAHQLADLAEHQRVGKCQADLAGGLEQQRVLPVEQERHGDRIRLCGKFRREGLPFLVIGIANQIRRKRDGAGRENNHGTALLQIFGSLLASLDIGGERGLGLVEIDRQDLVHCRGCLFQHPVRDDLVVGPHFSHQRAEHKTVNHTIGMVGDDKGGAGAGYHCAGVALQVDLDVQLVQCIRPEAGIGPIFLDIVEIKLTDFWLAAEPLNGSDQRIGDRPHFAVGEGEYRMCCLRTLHFCWSLLYPDHEKQPPSGNGLF